MNTLKRATLGFILVWSASANAVIIYDWVGLCDPAFCSTATGVLTMADTYVPGTSTSNPADYVSWAFFLDGVPGDHLDFGPDIFLGFDTVTLGVADGAFLGITDIGADLWTILDLVPPSAFGQGTTNAFVLRGDTPVPEPGTLGLLGAGLIGLAWRRRRAA